MRRILGILTIIMLTLLVACNGSKTSSTNGEGNNSTEQNAPQETSNESNSPSSPVVLAIGSSAEGGLYHTNAVAIAETINKFVDHVEARAEPTGGSVHNIRLLQNGEAKLGIVSADTMFEAIHGQGDFEGNPFMDFSIVVSGHTSYVHITVPEDSPINSVEDLQGKTVAWRLQGSSTVENMGRAIFAEYGLDPDKDFRSELASPYADAAQRMKDGRTDAVITFPGIPTPWIVEYTAADPLKMISIDQDKIQSIIEKYPFYIKGTIPANTYKGIDYDVETLAFKAMLVASNDVPENVIYEITKALLENKDYSVTVSQTIEPYVDKDNALSVQGIGGYHPGAIKYYKELGIWKE